MWVKVHKKCLTLWVHGWEGGERSEGGEDLGMVEKWLESKHADSKRNAVSIQ